MVAADYILADLHRRVMDLVRRGTIHSVQDSPPRCRVSFGVDPITQDEHISAWLLWYCGSDSERQEWRMPAVGAPAMVLSAGGELGGGVVFPGLLTDDLPAPSDKPNEHVTKYKDGAVVLYDTVAHQATVTLPEGGKVVVVATGGIKFQGDTEIDGNFKVTGNSTVDGDSSVGGNISAGGEISDKYGTVQAIRVTYNGHSHNENGDGGGVTDPPNQKMSTRKNRFRKRRKKLNKRR